MNPENITSVPTRRTFLQSLAMCGLFAVAKPWAHDGEVAEAATLLSPAGDPLTGSALTPHIKGKTPWAVVLCRFNDLPELSIPSSVFSDFVATSGAGGVCDYYRDVSYGAIDLSGSKVFGWYTMKYSFFADSLDPFKDGKTRGRIAWISEAIRLAKEDGVDLSKFYGVVAIINANADDSAWGRNFALGIRPEWGQNNWRWCKNCQGLAYAGHSTGVCPAGGAHDFSGSGDYTLAADISSFPGLSNWRWCKNCQGLAYGAFGAGACPAGGTHDHSSSGDYSLAHGKVGFPGQNQWKWCKNCQGLAYEGTAAGPCPAGGVHDHSSSGDFTLVGPFGSNLNVAFAGHEMGHCYDLSHAHCAGSTEDYCDPWDIMGAGYTYNDTTSRYSPVGPGLHAPHLYKLGWMREDRVRSYEPLRSSDGGAIRLAALNRPDLDGYLMARIILPDRVYTVEFRQRTKWDRGLPGDAVVIHQFPSLFTAGQNNWRWCKRCQGLAFAGISSGSCPAGGPHDHSESDDYSLVSGISGFSGQNNWRWCKRCQGLAYAGMTTAGACPAGGTHDHSSSGNYSLILGGTTSPGQNNWRWCKNCQGLAHAGSTAGACTAGGTHDHSSSGDYTLVSFGHDQPLLLGAYAEGQRWVDFANGISVLVDRIDNASSTATVII